MSESKLFNAIQLATGLAVVIGLVMVFVELRQAKSLTLAELTSDGYAEATADFRALMGENPAPIIAKACTAPDELQPDELVVLHAFYNSKLAQISRLRVLELVADFGVPWEGVAHQHLVDVVGTRPGRDWIDGHLMVDQELQALARDVIAAGADCTLALRVNADQLNDSES